MIAVRVRERADREHLQLAYTDPLTGSTRTKSAGTSDWKAAERAAAAWENELRQSHGLTGITWDMFRTRFEDEHLATVKPSTAKQYRYSLDRFEKEIGCPRDIRGINASTLSKFSARLRAANLKPDSIGSKLRDIKAALRWATRIGLLDKPPMVNIPPRGGSRGRPLTFQEVIRSFTTIAKVVPREHRDAITTLMKIMWLGGMRLSEALAISLEPGPIQVRFEGIPAIHWKLGSQKANRSEVTILPPDLYRYLENKKSCGVTKKFVQTSLSKRQIQDYLTAIGRQAEIKVSDTKHATAHDWRRTFGNRSALRYHPFVLKHLMRHKDINTTMRYYVDLPDVEIAGQVWSGVHGQVHASKVRVLKPRGPTPENTGEKSD